MVDACSVKEKYERYLLSIPGVYGVGCDPWNNVIVVYAYRGAKVPRVLDGVQVVVHYTMPPYAWRGW